MNNPLKYTDPSGYTSRPADRIDNYSETGQVSSGSANWYGTGGGGTMSWNLGTIYNYDGSIDYGGPSFYEANILGPTGNWVSKTSLRKDVKGTYNSQGAKTIQSYLQAGFDIQFRFNGTYNYALAIYGGKTLGSAAGVIWNSSFSHFGMHNGFNKGVNSFSVGASNEGYRYGNPLADIVTVGGSIASYYKNLPQKMAPIISKHFGGVDFKYGKTVGRLGTLGDVASTVGAINNLTNDPKSVENWADGVFAGAGWIPIYGDYGALLYTSAKSQIPIVQKNIIENKPTLNGVYNPATGDVWYGY